MPDNCPPLKTLLPLSLALVLSTASVHSQQGVLTFESLSVEEGMPTAVWSILQDRTGYLWFGSYSGLHRYDGYSFLSYKHDPDDTSSVDRNVDPVYEDKKGGLWAGSPLGLQKFDPTTGTFSHYTPDPSNTGGAYSNSVSAICEDKNGVFWVGTVRGLYHFNRTTGQFTTLRIDTVDPGRITSNFVNAIYEDREGSLWIAAREGLDRYDFAKGEFIHCWSNPASRYREWGDTSMYFVATLCEDEGGILWLGTNGGLVEFDPRQGTFARYRFNPPEGRNRIYELCQDRATGSLWLATGRELLSFDPKSKTFARYGYRANAVCRERSGTLWVGTNTYIQKLNRARQPFKKYPMSEIAHVVKEGKEGVLWILGPNAYRKFDIRREEFVPYSFGEDSVIFVYNAGGDVLLYSERDTVFTVDSSGTWHVWGTYSQDFMHTVSISWKGSKGYWIGSRFGGLFFLEFETKRLKEIKNFGLHIDFIYEDAGGMVWVATFLGKLFCYDRARDTAIEFISASRSPSTNSGRRVYDIYEDTKGTLWFATTDGLNRLDRSTDRFVRYSEKNGLASNNVRGVLEDDHGCLWIATNKGISRLDPETGRIKNFDITYGLEPTADWSWGRGCRTRNGEMYFGGAGGFTRFHPDSVIENRFVPPVVVTSFRKLDKPYPLTPDLRLAYDENFIGFEFAALSYVSPERNQYAYKLEGLDKDWVHAGTRRYASYPGLEPGEYIFRVRGSNNDGVWNEAGTSVAIVIVPPWWKSAWAYLLYVMVILTVLYVTWQMQVKRIRMRHEYEMSRFEAKKFHELDEMKSRFFANISHEFRTPLTLILGPVRQAIETIEDEKVRSDLKVVHKNANRLLGLVNQLLDISTLESGTMRLRTVSQDIVPLLKALVLSFTSYAERKRITLRFTAGEDEIRAYVDKEKVEKIITNILANAFKFTPEAGRIDVTVTQSQDRVTVAVRDTGIGIPSDRIPRIFDRFYQVDGSHTRTQEGTGIGLSLTKELVELHRGSIEVESTEGKGTTFTVHLPLGKAHLKPEEICGPEDDEGKGVVAGGRASVVPEEMVYPEETKPEKVGIGAITDTGKALLLIVEDNADVRRYIATNVKKDYRVLEAMDGEDGWHKSVEYLPDVIVSDVMMPRMDGFALCNRLKTDERTSHIPVILLTAKASSRDKIEGLKTGADDYIMKPFEPTEVTARIRNLVEQRRRIHEHFKKHGLYEIEDRSITPVDQKFLQNALAAITRHLSDSAFGVESLATELAVSRSVLLKKIEALVGEPPSELIKRTRLTTAAKLIESRFGNISEIALEVGFSSPSHFADCFRKQFGASPSQYRHNSTQQ